MPCSVAERSASLAPVLLGCGTLKPGTSAAMISESAVRPVRRSCSRESVSTYP
jgi:hypothetical protein